MQDIDGMGTVWQNSEILVTTPAGRNNWFGNVSASHISNDTPIGNKSLRTSKI